MNCQKVKGFNKTSSRNNTMKKKRQKHTGNVHGPPILILDNTKSLSITLTKMFEKREKYYETINELFLIHQNVILVRFVKFYKFKNKVNFPL